MEHWIPIIRDWLAGHQSWLVVAIVGTAFLESLAIIGLVVPAMAIMFAVGTLAGGSGMNVWVLLASAWFGAATGDCLSYFLGRTLHERIHQVWPFSRYPVLLDRGEHYFQRHGGKSVILGRFIGPLRPVLPMVAGALDMSARRFIVYEIIASAAWSPTYVLPGFLVGASMTLHMNLPRHFYLTLGIVLAVFAATFFVFVRLHWAMEDEGRLYRTLRTWTRGHPLLKRTWQALSSRRADRGEFPLPSLALTIVSLVLFVGFTLFIAHTHWLGQMDRATTAFFLTLRNPLLDPAFLGLALLGDIHLLWLSFALFALFLWMRGLRVAALHVVIAAVAAMELSHLVKLWCQIPRPMIIAHPPSSSAYPSTNTCGMTVFMGLVSAFVAREWRWRRRWLAYVYASIPIGLVAMSRLYLGAHWFTDVIGGLLLGLAICGATRFSYSSFDHQPLKLNGQALVFAAGWVLVAAGYLYWRWPEAQMAYQLLGTG